MSEKPKLVIFKNKRQPKPEDKFKPSDYNGKITLPEWLAAGEYEVGIFLNEFQNKKTGEIEKYMSGNIRPAYKKDEQSQPKQSVNSVNEDGEIPF